MVKINWIGVTSLGWSEGSLSLKSFSENRAQMELNIEPLFFTLVGSLVDSPDVEGCDCLTASACDSSCTAKF